MAWFWCGHAGRKAGRVACHHPLTRWGHSGAQTVERPVVAAHVMGRMQGPACFDPRCATVFRGEQQRQRLADPRAASGFCRQMQPPYRHHGGRCGQVCDHGWRAAIAQRLLHCPQHIIALVGCDKQQLARVDQISNPIGAKGVCTVGLTDPDHGSVKPCCYCQCQGAPRRTAEFVHTAQPKRNFSVTQRDLGVSAVWASG